MVSSREPCTPLIQSEYAASSKVQFGIDHAPWRVHTMDVSNTLTTYGEYHPWTLGRNINAHQILVRKMVAALLQRVDPSHFPNVFLTRTTSNSFNTHPISSTETTLVALNITAQINEKLTSSTFPQWRAQFEALLIGYDLLDYVTGISQCPSPSDLSVSALHKTHWVRQDKLILSALLASTSPTITPLIATAKMSHEACVENRPISDYLHAVLISGKLQHQSELREMSLAFEELHDLLVGHEHYLHRLETATQQLVAAANYTTRKSGSSGGQQRSYSKPNGPQRQSGQAPARSGNRDGRRPNGSNRPQQQPALKPSEITANSATTSTMKEQKWLLDSAASHNITGDLQNLSIHSEYDGTDEVVLGDGFSHYTTAPYTPQQNGVSERRHRHLVETGLTLLSDASLPLSYWPHAFRTATYLINRQPTPLLTNRNSGSHSDVLISHDPVLPSSLHPTHTHTVADLTLSQSHSIPPSCVQTGDPRLHKMTTRSMNNIFKPKQLHLVSKHPIPLAIEPTCVTQAVNHPQWRDAMSTELTALMKHGAWDLARLVAKGYTQIPSLDYKETFSPVVRPATIRCVLTIAMMNGWPLRQMDINNAFLHGTLIETVYMTQPPGFKDTSKPDHVCRLRKAIYGLRQAPRAWYTALRTALFQLGFKNSKADSSLFIYTHGPIICYFLVYVDDLVITGNDIQFVDHIIQKLGENFSLKDMGNLSFFLGVEVIPTHAGLFLSHHQYIRDLLSTTNMLGAKDVSTPLSTTASLKLFDGTTPIDSIDFRRVIGSLQYLSLTRPDISFAVNKLSQFMHKPTTTHWTATKRLLRYLKQTIFHGIQLTRNTTSVLTTSKKQRVVARSSTEAEYRALANAASETVWLNSLLHELGFPLKVPPLLLCDNLGATHLSFNPVNHSRMKHIQIDLHFVRELVQNGTLHVIHAQLVSQLIHVQLITRLRCFPLMGSNTKSLSLLHLAMAHTSHLALAIQENPTFKPPPKGSQGDFTSSSLLAKTTKLCILALGTFPGNLSSKELEEKNGVCEISQTLKRAAKYFRNTKLSSQGCKVGFHLEGDFAALCKMLPSARSDWLVMAATSSFQLRIAHRLKHWIVDFLRFEMVYSMHHLDFRNCSKSGYYDCNQEYASWQILFAFSPCNPDLLLENNFYALPKIPHSSPQS
ncbi:Retrovirus-related Pol polyprotein from transposon RE2 [Vitis vinifera]|uniref:Retrovirus-related Pol polyprotein from transposon RE2 n=1 Tax=Vitis vinifera TaxID=29760 RepID=A0A438GSA7_VITVI|nr:Retrovirus-related Pol polyprotein from transposon RE2 [Vitis vinifera]